jgi:L-lysine 2,3-aminomutase
MKVRYITHLSKLDGLTDEERRRLAPVADRYVFRLNDYYQDLINWDDPNDPLRRLVVPLEGELSDWGELDVARTAATASASGCS